MDETALVLRSPDGVLSTSNLYFVVYKGAKLTFAAKEGITLDRDEVSMHNCTALNGNVRIPFRTAVPLLGTNYLEGLRF